MVTKFNDGWPEGRNAQYLKRKANGSYYYQRRVPLDLKEHYGPKACILKSLKTMDEHIALKRAKAQAAIDEALWSQLRKPDAKELGITTKEARARAEALLTSLGLSPNSQRKGELDEHDPLDEFLSKRYGAAYEKARDREDKGRLAYIVSPIEMEAWRLLHATPGAQSCRLSDACALYLKLHRRGDIPRFKADAGRSIQYLIQAVGDLPLEKYTRKDARAFVDYLLAHGSKTTSVRRALSVINPIFKMGVREFEIKGVNNPFEALDIPKEGTDATTRDPFTEDELHTIAAACLAKDDDIRHIIAIQLDTGARAGEIIGLRREDVFLEHDIPHIWIRPHAKGGRTLKTSYSVRKVPLVGGAAWGVFKALEATKRAPNGWLFPRYASDKEIKATYAENTINKWLKSLLGGVKTSHSFRHSMRDRLRHADAPGDIQNEIGGWGVKTIGQSYGEGYSLTQKQKFLVKVTEGFEPWPRS